MHFKMITYNIHKGKGAPGAAPKPSLHDICTGLAQQNADLILCQEVAEIKQKVSQCCEIAKSLNIDHHYGANTYFRHANHGNAIFSRFPTAFNCNLNITTQAFKQRGILYATIKLNENQRVHVFNVHLSNAPLQKSRQLSLLIKYIKILTRAEDPLVIAGVLNDYRGAVHNILTQHYELKSALQMLSKREQKTWPSMKPAFCLDQIFYRHLHLLETKVLTQQPWGSLSDHLPIYAEFVC